jgi:cell division septum initiation protein DivIVA
MLITQKEMQSLLDQVNNHFQGTFQRLTDLEEQMNQLEAKVEELYNASKEGSKTSTGRGKRVQQTKADA